MMRVARVTNILDEHRTNPLLTDLPNQRSDLSCAGFILGGQPLRRNEPQPIGLPQIIERIMAGDDPPLTRRQSAELLSDLGQQHVKLL